jgi:hypothetical protein
LQTLGRKLAYYNGHFPDQITGLAQVDGSTTDYSYGELGVASFTYELGTFMFQSCDYFESEILNGNIRSLVYALKTVRAPYQLPAGPEGYGLSLSANGPVAPGDDISLVVTYDDTRYNHNNGVEPSQDISMVEYYVGVAPWLPGAEGSAFTMNATDGSFNSGIEEASAIIDTSELADGRHTVYTRAQDSDGNWGVVSAVFIDIDSDLP